MAFATSRMSDEEKYLEIHSDLSAEESEQILALKFTEYEKMSIKEFQDKVWRITDTEEYQKILECVAGDNTLYKQKDSNPTASFFFNILEPLTAEKWQEKEFGGYAQTAYKEASDNALLEYSFTMTIKNPQTLTVEDMEKSYSSDQLQVELNYIYQPLSELKADNTIEASIEGQEEREYPNATREDYQSLLALKSSKYQAISVSEFNRKLMEWANEDYGRSERISIDYIRGDYSIPLSKDEKKFIELTVRASGIENADIENKDTLSIGERDRYLSNVLSEIQQFWDDTEIHKMMRMDKKDIEKQFNDIAVKNSNKEMTFSIVEGQVYFEHRNP